MGPGLRSDLKQGQQLDPKVVAQEEDQGSMSGCGAGSPRPVEGHSQSVVGSGPVTWFSPALSKTALRSCTEVGL